MSDETVTVVEIGGIAVAIKKPGDYECKLATLISDAAYRDAVAAGRPATAPRPEPARAAALRRALATDGRELAKTRLPARVRRRVALRMRRDRAELRDLLAARGDDALSATEAADQAQFDSLVATTTTYHATGAPVFAGQGDYQRRGAEPFAVGVAEAVAKVLYGVTFPEEDFLRRHPLPTQPQLAA